MIHFLFDNNLSPRYASLAKAADLRGNDIFHLKDRLPHDTPDREWISYLSTLGDKTAAFTKDGRILTVPEERQALEKAGCHVFYFTKAWFKLPASDQFWKLVKAWPQIIEACERNPPSRFKIPVSGNTIARDGRI